MKFCPNCGEAWQNQQSDTCSACGFVLPENLRAAVPPAKEPQAPLFKPMFADDLKAETAPQGNPSAAVYAAEPDLFGGAAQSAPVQRQEAYAQPPVQAAAPMPQGGNLFDEEAQLSAAPVPQGGHLFEESTPVQAATPVAGQSGSLFEERAPVQAVTPASQSGTLFEESAPVQAAAPVAGQSGTLFEGSAPVQAAAPVAGQSGSLFEESAPVQAATPAGQSGNLFEESAPVRAAAPAGQSGSLFEERAPVQAAAPLPQGANLFDKTAQMQAVPAPLYTENAPQQAAQPGGAGYRQPQQPAYAPAQPVQDTRFAQQAPAEATTRDLYAKPEPPPRRPQPVEEAPMAGGSLFGGEEPPRQRAVPIDEAAFLGNARPSEMPPPRQWPYEQKNNEQAARAAHLREMIEDEDYYDEDDGYDGYDDDDTQVFSQAAPKGRGKGGSKGGKGGSNKGLIILAVILSVAIVGTIVFGILYIGGVFDRSPAAGSTSTPAAVSQGASAPISTAPASSAAPPASTAETLPLSEADMTAVISRFYTSYLACINAQSVDPLESYTASALADVQERLQLSGNQQNLFEYGSTTIDAQSIVVGEVNGMTSVTLNATFTYNHKPRDDAAAAYTQGSNHQTIQLVNDNGEWKVNRLVRVDDESFAAHTVASF